MQQVCQMKSFLAVVVSAVPGARASQCYLVERNKHEL